MAYKAGMHLLITQACAQRAEELGRGKRERKPKANRNHVSDLERSDAAD